jgi:hypothetical protein
MNLFHSIGEKNKFLLRVVCICQLRQCEMCSMLNVNLIFVNDITSVNDGITYNYRCLTHGSKAQILTIFYLAYAKIKLQFI